MVAKIEEIVTRIETRIQVQLFKIDFIFYNLIVVVLIPDFD